MCWSLEFITNDLSHFLHIFTLTGASVRRRQITRPNTRGASSLFGCVWTCFNIQMMWIDVNCKIFLEESGKLLALISISIFLACSAFWFCQDGFYRLLVMGLRTVQNGAIILGPPCSLYVFMSSSVHLRHIFGELGVKGCLRNSFGIKRKIYVVKLIWCSNCLFLIGAFFRQPGKCKDAVSQ
jgi:hypothetical protein